MVCVGIDVAKDKHDCCILDSDGTIRADCITIPNNMDGFKQLFYFLTNVILSLNLALQRRMLAKFLESSICYSLC